MLSLLLGLWTSKVGKSSVCVWGEKKKITSHRSSSLSARFVLPSKRWGTPHFWSARPADKSRWRVGLMLCDSPKDEWWSFKYSFSSMHAHVMGFLQGNYIWHSIKHQAQYECLLLIKRHTSINVLVPLYSSRQQFTEFKIAESNLFQNLWSYLTYSATELPLQCRTNQNHVIPWAARSGMSNSYQFRSHSAHFDFWSNNNITCPLFVLKFWCKELQIHHEIGCMIG